MSGSTGKQYVTVQVTHNADGSMTPNTIMYPGGKMYHVSYSAVMGQSEREGKTVRTYRVAIGKRITELYQEKDRWFVLSR